MLEFKVTLVLLLCLVPGGLAIPDQAPFAAQSWGAEDYASASGVFSSIVVGRLTVVCACCTPEPRRKLQGRFLHITDMHPDPHYRVGSSEKKACHRGKPKKGKRAAGYYGLPYR